MVMYANEFEAKEKQKLTKIKNNPQQIYQKVSAKSLMVDGICKCVTHSLSVHARSSSLRDCASIITHGSCIDRMFKATSISVISTPGAIKISCNITKKIVADKSPYSRGRLSILQTVQSL